MSVTGQLQNYKICWLSPGAPVFTQAKKQAKENLLKNFSS